MKLLIIIILWKRKATRTLTKAITIRPKFILYVNIFVVEYNKISHHRVTCRLLNSYIMYLMLFGIQDSTQF